MTQLRQDFFLNFFRCVKLLVKLTEAMCAGWPPQGKISSSNRSRGSTLLQPLAESLQRSALVGRGQDYRALLRDLPPAAGHGRGPLRVLENFRVEALKALKAMLFDGKRAEKSRTSAA